MNNGGIFNDLRNEINNFSIDRRIKKMTGKLFHQCVIWEPLLSMNYLKKVMERKVNVDQ